MYQPIPFTTFKETTLADFSDEIRPACKSEFQAIAPIVSSLSQWTIGALTHTEPFVVVDSIIMPPQTYDDGTPFVVTETVFSKTKSRGIEWRILTSAQLRDFKVSSIKAENKEQIQTESAASLFPHAISSHPHLWSFNKNGEISNITHLPLVSFFSKDGSHGIDFLQVELVKKGTLQIQFGSIVYIQNGSARYKNSLCLLVDLENCTYQVDHQNPNIRLADLRSLRTAYIAISKAMSDEFEPQEPFWRFASLDLEPN